MRLRWQRSTGSTWGDAAFASLAIAALTGIALAMPYDVRAPYDSLASLLLTNPAGSFFRSLHYWSSQAFVLLTLVHAWDHLRRSTERHVPSGVWLRVSLSIPLGLFLVLSGFLLRGDAEATQAGRIVSTAAGYLPLVGPLLTAALFGAGPGSLQLVYVHHVATATLFTWLIVAEHARAVWPRRVTLVVTTLPLVALAAFVTPSLHDGLALLVKGPWYFVGLQEVLHFVARPLLVVAASLVALAGFAALPRLSSLSARRVKIALAGLLAAYAAASVVAGFFRDENWRLAPPSRSFEPGLVVAWPGPGADEKTLVAKPIPVVLGRREGCLFCHQGVKGLSDSHRPEAVGCASCHGGNPFSLDRRVAHRAMRVVPGNLADAGRSCGTAACHPAIVDRVSRSIMTTMSGVVAVDRKVFGERSGDMVRVSELQHSAADSHLRQLCASCHLGTVKTVPGPVAEDSRGGGCLACHVAYAPGVDAALLPNRLRKEREGSTLPAPVHANIALPEQRASLGRIDQDPCFGCHSRSGRIATNYQGWQELEEGANASPGERVRDLKDGRRFVFVKADVHAERGLQCIDCHTSREVMGDGNLHARKADQVRVACEDCHFRGPARTLARKALDPESAKLLTLRATRAGSADVLVTKRGDPLVNTVAPSQGAPATTITPASPGHGPSSFILRPEKAGRGPGNGQRGPDPRPLAPDPYLLLTSTGERRELRGPAAVCVEGAGHSRLSCISCHSAWAPRCSGCHTTFDPTAKAFDHLAQREVSGAWNERGSDYRAAPPTLGITGSGASARIETFVPGMVLTIDRNRAPGRPPDNVARRLYARAFAHTITRGSRSCESCHTDPEALGYGRGALKYKAGPDGGRWSFVPALPASSFDRLPADAWIPFLGEAPAPAGGIGPGTRPDVRPLTRDEQRRVLTVGACLTCHKGDSAVMRDSVRDFASVMKRVTTKCVMPRW